MRRFVLGWKQLGHESRLDAHIVNYADDFVICCRNGADKAMEVMLHVVPARGLKLTDFGELSRVVNATKTHVCRMPDETFDFLTSVSSVEPGYTLGRCYSSKTGRSYIGTKPAKKRVARVCSTISEHTDRCRTHLDAGEVVAQLNRLMTGWSNYFCLGPVSRAYHAVDQHARERQFDRLTAGCVNGCARSTRCQAGEKANSPICTCTSGWVSSNSVGGRRSSRGLEETIFSESRMRENRPSGSMSGTWKRSQGHRATSRLYPGITSFSS